jgi:hypothetical protein
MAVWDVPTPVEVDASVPVRVGARCEHNCNLSGAVVRIFDANGNLVSQGVLGESPAPGTAALHWAQLSFSGPPEVGYHEWTARFADREGPTVHRESSFRFGFVTTARMLHRFTVSVSDAATKATLADAYVRMGSSTIYSDDNGKARGSVPAGEIDLVVWKRDHQMFRSRISVLADEELAVELTPQPCKYCPDSV